MREIRRIRIGDQDDRTWAWTDVVTGERGRLRRDGHALEAGDECVVELEATGAEWRAARWLIVPARDEALPPLDARKTAPPILVNGRPAATDGRRSEADGRRGLEAGSIRLVRHHMDSRSTARRDIGETSKSRPAVILSIHRDTDQVEIAFIFGTNSAVQRTGTGRRIRHWREAGLRKPSVLSASTELRRIDDLGPEIGRLDPADRSRFGVA